LRQNGICEVVICAGYLGQLIADFVGDGSKFGLSVRFSYDGAKPLGTGGAIKRALPLLGDAFWVMYGDAYLNVVFRQVADFFLSRDKLGLMTVYKNNNQWDTSNVVFLNDLVVKYDKQRVTADMQYIDYGVALLSRACFDDFAKDTFFDLAEVYQRLVNKKEMLGYEVKERFYEIGSLRGLAETRKYLSSLSVAH
jgi:NDP-sugar pyrophosphorylase family protein